ncbi:hypothetical protein A2U01_0079516, partial [Trifolium medium]|nr:hypothetical protein [Trifolium medium]
MVVAMATREEEKDECMEIEKKIRKKRGGRKGGSGINSIYVFTLSAQ